MKFDTKYTPAQQLANLASIMTILLDSEACADRALQMNADLDALDALAASSELAREVQVAVAARLNAESKEDEGTRVPLLILGYALAEDAAVAVERALVLAGAAGGPGDMPAPALDELRRAMAAEGIL